ncbi:amidase [Pseudooceanicola sp. GBMRC 2024]|uniref:Amidase n=1 Tax=Pseudooceanicola albus TaxID=2692189 RepID=A0A6L7G595_9RHOB|nr:amidase family protein [Pseudooceanicola albus]MXN17813.1 amidase [Pseudooceanicola albus]
MNISSSTDERFAWASVSELTRGYASGAFTPLEVAESLLARIARLNGRVNAVVDLAPERTLAMARASTRRWQGYAPLSALDGVPVTIKDLSAIAGWPRWRGGLAADDSPMPEDTPAVARLREAGAVFLGRTATPEGGAKVVTRSPRYGETLNPYDIGRTAGGSSGGAAAALAMGVGPLALGSDGAGSLRIPASHCNVVGVKPGFGRVPAFPPDTDLPHSVVGPMARSVADASAMLEILSRPEPRDPFAWPVPHAAPDLEAGLAGLRIAFSARLGCTAPLVDPEVDALVARAVPLLEGAGAEVTQDDPVWPVDPHGPFAVFWRAACAESLRAVPEGARALVDPLIRAVAAEAGDIDLARYQQAVADRLALAAAARAFFNRHDLLVGPVMPVPAYPAGRDVPEGFGETDWRWCPYTYPWNMTGQPALSVPVGFTAAGLPVGVQIIAAMGQEAVMLRAARAIERAAPLYRQIPPAAL